MGVASITEACARGQIPRPGSGAVRPSATRAWWARWKAAERSLYMSAVAQRQVERMRRMRVARARQGDIVKAPKVQALR